MDNKNNKPKFTPGRFKYERETSTIRTVPENYCVCVLDSHPNGGHTDGALFSEIKDFGHLIAASPDMFEALERVEQRLSGVISEETKNCKGKDKTLLYEIRTAFAKAKGES